MPTPSVDHGFIEVVRAGLDESGWEPLRPLVVALSGGADSTALLLACAAIAKEAGGQLSAAHFDHGIRPDSSREGEYADMLGHQLGIPVMAGVGNVPEFATARSISIETAARELRYRFLADTVAEAGAQGVATGHTLDDQAETVLLNALRGTGTRGLSGMRRRTLRPAGPEHPSLTVLRPLLAVRHADCESACRSAGVQWLEDPSNKDRSFLRNRVRHELLTLAEEIRPGATFALARLAENVRDSDSFLAKFATSECRVTVKDGTASVNRSRLRSLHPTLQQHVIASMYESATGGIEGLERSHILAMRDLVSGGSGTELSLPGGMVFRVDFNTCSISRADSSDALLPSDVPELELGVPGQVELPGGFTITAKVVEPPADPAAFGPKVAYLAMDAVQGCLRVRARRPGDRFQPLGMEPEVRLQDYFVNAHVPERFRDRTPLVESERGIAWVAGHRIAEWAKLRPDTRKAIRLQLSAAAKGSA